MGDLLDPNALIDANATGLEQPQEFTEEELQHSVLIFYIVMFVMIFAQSALVSWRKRHKRSYELVTLVGLWLIPPIICLQVSFWRFFFVWALYSSITCYFFYQCTYSKTMDKHVPKHIYKWFFTVFKMSVGIGIAGYSLMLIEMFLMGMLQGPLIEQGFAITLIWYGLYFGILTRDCAEVASDRIANRLGTARKMAVSVRDCALCGGELRDAHTIGGRLTINRGIDDGTLHTNAMSGNLGGGDRLVENGQASVQLSCKHIFHPECIRGWLIVGKKDSCPTCQEKVDLRALYAGKPWETSNISWIQMLDMIRYFVVWQPTILTLLHFFFHAFQLDEVVDHGAAAGNNSTMNGTATMGMSSHQNGNHTGGV